MRCECPCRVMGVRDMHACTGKRDDLPRIECFRPSGEMLAIHPCLPCRSANLRVIVTGSRSIPYSEWDKVRKILDMESDFLIDQYGTVAPIIVQGGARGIDTMARIWAQRNCAMSEKHFPDYKKYGRSKAPHVRNKLMVDLGANLVIGIIKDDSKGTRSCLNKAKAKGLLVHEHTWT